jgi:PAS domain S-box-containing protein
MSIIIVNDDVTQLSILSALLKKGGYATRSFASAEQALRGMEAGSPPDLIVTDLYMPGIDGWRFCRLLRSPEFQRYNRVPILVVSATFAGDETNRIATEIGADAFLPSPVDGERLLAVARSLLAGEANAAPPRVLIVEDSRSLAEALRSAFQSHGYRADALLKGRQGISAFRGEKFDAAVIDYHLPDGAGDSLLRGFRAWNPACVCIMMTSDPRPGLALEWMKAGAAAYVRKPFQPEYMVALCDRARRERAMLRVEELLEKRTRQLRTSEALNRTVVDSLDEGAHIVGPDLRILLFNRRLREWREELGLGGDAPGRPLGEVFPFLPDKVLAEYNQVFDTGEPLFTEEDFWLGDRRFFTEVRKIPIFGADGVDSVLTVVSDVTDRREAEARLRRNNEEQTLLLDAIPTQVWYLTGAERYGRVNQAHADFLGQEKVRLEGRPLHSFLPAAEAEICRDGNRRVFETRRAVRTEEWVKNGEGHVRLLQIDKSPWLDSRGDVEYIVCAATDITELRETQQALRAERDFADGLVETAPVIILVLDLEGRIVRFNRFMENLCGRPLAEVNGADWFTTFFRPEGVPMARERFRASLAGEATHGERFEILAADGRELMVEWFDTILRDSGGNPVGLLAIGHDETELIRCEIEIHREKERLEQVIQGTRAGIWEWRVATGEAWFSERWAEITGHTLEELAPVSIRTWLELCHPDDLAVSEDRLRAIFSGEKDFYQCDCRMRHKSGRWIWVRDRGRVVEWDQAGAPVRMVGTHIDVTRDKEVERERQRLDQQAYQIRKAESLERMAGAIAHHFNNLLFGILGNLELAEEEAPRPSPLHANLTAAIEASHRASDLSGRMLTYLGYFGQNLTPLDLPALCRDALSQIRSRLPENIHLAANVGEGDITVLAKAENIRQILENLVENAREAMEEDGGTIRIRLYSVPGREIEPVRVMPVGFQPLPDRSYAVLEVSDSGSGVPPEDRERLFDPFFSTRFAGRGLGLAVVLGTVKALGGGVDLESEAGRGSRFRVILPLAEESQEGEYKTGAPFGAPVALASFGRGRVVWGLRGQEPPPITSDSAPASASGSGVSKNSFTSVSSRSAFHSTTMKVQRDRASFFFSASAATWAGSGPSPAGSSPAGSAVSVPASGAASPSSAAPSAGESSSASSALPLVPAAPSSGESASASPAVSAVCAPVPGSASGSVSGSASGFVSGSASGGVR